jgi:hypothetical protein
MEVNVSKDWRDQEILIENLGGNAIVGNRAEINDSRRGPTTTSTSLVTLAPDQYYDLMAKIDAIMHSLEDLLGSAEAATDESLKRRPKREVIREKLAEISVGITTTASFVAAVKLFIDEAAKLVR